MHSGAREGCTCTSTSIYCTVLYHRTHAFILPEAGDRLTDRQAGRQAKEEQVCISSKSDWTAGLGWVDG